MNRILVVGVNILLFSCGRTEPSDIEVIKIEQQQIDKIISNSSSSKIDTIGRKDFYTEEVYEHKAENKVSRILRNQAGNVVGLIQDKIALNYN